MRAVIYARYSTELQSASSIEDQIRLCRERVVREGWTYLNAYTDRASSGASALRAGYQQLLEDARAKHFEVVVAEALDRLSRDQEHVAALFKLLAFAGVKLLTLAEGEITELHIGLKGTMNALFLKDLAAKTHRGLRGRVEQGRSGGGLCFGYDVIREVGHVGEPVRGGRCVNEPQAAVVRQIFSEFVAGRSPRAIAQQLNTAGVPGPGGRPWGDTTIRGHSLRGTGILRNELYVGRLVWNRLHYLKDPRTGKRISRLNPRSEWITQEVPAWRIVDQPLWERAQARLGAIRETPASTKLRASRFWERRRAKSLLTDKTTCGVCGGPLVAVGQDYLACSQARRQGTCGNRRGIRRSILENIILDALKHRLMLPDMVKEFIAAFHSELNHRRADQQAECVSRERELQEVKRKLERLIDAIIDGLRGPGVQARLDDLETKKANLERELAAPAPTTVRLHPNLAEIYRQKVENLRTALSQPDTEPEALEILRSLVERVVVSPKPDGVEIELVGEIATMVALA